MKPNNITGAGTDIRPFLDGCEITIEWCVETVKGFFGNGVPDENGCWQIDMDKYENTPPSITIVADEVVYEKLKSCSHPTIYGHPVTITNLLKRSPCDDYI